MRRISRHWIRHAVAIPAMGVVCAASARTPVEVDWTLGWKLDQRLAPTGSAYEDGHTGRAVAIDEDLVVVGAPYADYLHTDEGQARVYRFDGSSWVHERNLTNYYLGDGANLGFSVDLDADADVPRVILGAPGTNAATGSAEIWKYESSSWSREDTLTDTAGSSGDDYGYAVAIEGDLAIVGAPGKDNGHGAVFLYERSGSTWSLLEEFDGPSEVEDHDHFGQSLDMAGVFFVVGAPDHDSGIGAAYVYRDQAFLGLGWGYWQKLTDGYGTYGNVGTDVAISETSLAVGAPGMWGSDKGAVNVYTIYYNDSAYPGEPWSWQWQAGSSSTPTLWRSDVAAGDRFGDRVSVDGSWVVVGAPGRDVAGAAAAGELYVYRNLSEFGTYVEDPIVAGNAFGLDVDIEDCRLVVGARYYDHVPWFYPDDTGAAYVFKCTGSIFDSPFDLPWPGTARISGWSPPYACGWGGVSGDTQAILWEEQDDGSWTSLALPDIGSASRAVALGQQGGEISVAGTVRDGQDRWLAAVWSSGDGAWSLEILPMPQGGTDASVSAVGSTGEIVAGAIVVGGSSRGALWSQPNGEWQAELLPSLPNGGDAEVTSIDERPDAPPGLIGFCKTGQGLRRPVRWQPVGTGYEIIPLPPLPGGGIAGTATEIRAHDGGETVILGQLEGADGSMVPVQWEHVDGIWRAEMLGMNAPLADLEPSSMAAGSLPGPIVGFGYDSLDRVRGVVWAAGHAGGELHDLTDVLAGALDDRVIREAVAMDRDGRIAVNMSPPGDPDGPLHATVLAFTDVAEPDPCPTDLDGDGATGFTDLSGVLGAWGSCAACAQDFDGDGAVGFADLVTLLAGWGPCP